MTNMGGYDIKTSEKAATDSASCVKTLRPLMDDCLTKHSQQAPFGLRYISEGTGLDV